MYGYGSQGMPQIILDEIREAQWKSDRIPGYPEESEDPDGETIDLQVASYEDDIEEYEAIMDYDSENDTMTGWCDEE